MSLSELSSWKSESNSETDKSLLAEVELFGNLIAGFGVQVALVSPAALDRLGGIPAEQKNELIRFLKLWRNWISSETKLGDKASYSETQTLRKALKYHGLEAHEDFWKTIKSDQFIEFYNPQMIQIYRSLSFLDISCYSILDLMTNEWFVLWKRPQRVTDQLLKTADKYANSYVPVQKFDVPKHILREVFNTGLTEPFVPRATLVEFQYIGTLVDTITRKPAGFICTSTGHVIASGEEAESLDFI